PPKSSPYITSRNIRYAIKVATLIPIRHSEQTCHSRVRPTPLTEVTRADRAEPESNISPDLSTSSQAKPNRNLSSRPEQPGFFLRADCARRAAQWRDRGLISASRQSLRSI